MNSQTRLHGLEARSIVATSRLKTGNGIYQTRRKTVPEGVTKGGVFFMHGTSSMVGREGCYSRPSFDAHAGSLFRSLVGPHGSPPVHYQGRVATNQATTEGF
jgi:hypothetical protein